MKILLFITQLEAAGAQKALLTLARGLQDRGHQVTVVAMYDKGGYASAFREQYGVEIADLDMNPRRAGGRLRLVMRVAAGVARLYRLARGGFDVFQAFGPYCNLLGPLVGSAAGIPVRVTSQRSSLKAFPGWFRWLDRLVTNSRMVRRMIAVSDATRRYSIEVEGISPGKITTIRNSIDTKRFSPLLVTKERLAALAQELFLPDQSLKVITIARLDMQKGHEFLIEAIPSIQRRFPTVRLLLVGEGALRGELIRKSQDLGLGDVVQFLGVRQDIPELLALSDLFVLPSLWEGLPNVLLEAMAMGIPVIATNVDGCPEIVEHGRTGLLVAPCDPAALAEAICSLLGDASARMALSAAGHEWIEREFTEERFISSFEQLYEQLLPMRSTDERPRPA